MSNKASILYYSLLFYLFFISIMTNLMVRLHYVNYESQHYSEIEAFSYIESYVLQLTIQALRQEKFKPFLINSDLGSIEVRVEDEVAWLFFNFDHKRYARLDYDLVFDSTISYVYLNEAEFSFVDKVSD